VYESAQRLNPPLPVGNHLTHSRIPGARRAASQDGDVDAIDDRAARRQVPVRIDVSGYMGQLDLCPQAMRKPNAELAENCIPGVELGIPSKRSAGWDGAPVRGCRHGSVERARV